MRILFFIDNLLPGGKERRFVELLKGLKAFPYIEFEIVVMNKDIHYDQVFNLMSKIHLLERRIKKDLSVFQKFYKICKGYRPDMIHTWDDMTTMIAIPACKLLNIKLINGMVTNTPVKRNILNKTWLIAKLTFPFSDKIIGNSNAGLNGYGAPAKKSVCIYNGMDFKRFKNLNHTNDFRKEILGDRTGSNFIVGMVAAFEPRKDYKTLITSALSLVKSCESITFILVGDGTDFISTKNMVPPEFSDRIIFLGKRSDIESIVNLFDVGVLLTNSKVHGEGISNSIIEYMALGKPVIATRGGGTNEVVVNNQNGYLINPHNSEELIDCIETLKNDIKLRQQFGAKSVEITQNTFDLRIMTENYIKVYQEVLQVKMK
jgi:glycosyltransferase involved in cell wall biosynthesis